MDRRDLIRIVRECASRYDTSMACAFRRALGIGAKPKPKPRRKKRKRVKGIGYCIRNESSPMDRDM